MTLCIQALCSRLCPGSAADVRFCFRPQRCPLLTNTSSGVPQNALNHNCIVTGRFFYCVSVLCTSTDDSFSCQFCQEFINQYSCLDACACVSVLKAILSLLLLGAYLIWNWSLSVNQLLMNVIPDSLVIVSVSVSQFQVVLHFVFQALGQSGITVGVLQQRVTAMVLSFFCSYSSIFPRVAWPYFV